MAKRTYDQYCALAKALDVVGERWTLLILRELFAGPQWFSDLLHILPGIGNGMLQHLFAFVIRKRWTKEIRWKLKHSG